MGLDPRTLGSRPEPKADAQPLSHPGASLCVFVKSFYVFQWACLLASSPVCFPELLVCFDCYLSYVLDMFSPSIYCFPPTLWYPWHIRPNMFFFFFLNVFCDYSLTSVLSYFNMKSLFWQTLFFFLKNIY